ncbi:glycoside hydrolase family 32 protein [Luteolibacter sp. GHJ8]|uniref:Glycoside hydrolase family 32 protein n=1 Tax=Luteolibacter rhizosphaerae TaxID=2989719 RepID=A0ABT3G6H9_9BACT|nr:glycoside hydrolase family 32 protein [Luteolibacter rhizosphaerae]MCW1915442.1 glycoside hydrolase family 32 protein [Luteolibacter rhizosphaerae]
MRISLRGAVFAVSALAALPALAEKVLLFPNSDFEAGTLENWTASGTAFTRQPTFGDNTAARGNVSCGEQGNYWIGTFENYDGVTGNPGDTRGDGATGTLTSQEFTITKRYITCRIGGGNHPGITGAKLLCEGLEYAIGTGLNSEAMFPATFDAAALQGKLARIVIFDQATGGWGHINADDFAANDETAVPPDGAFAFTPGIPKANVPPVGYDQPLRPQFHFSSRRNWLNDPNGMVFDGEHYHLFFQHNPLGTGWGNMTWGHAISTDMLHWRQLNHALLPYQVDGRSGTIYSGSAVVDHNNSLGAQVGSRKTLVSFFTYASEPFYQAMAYSTDGGVTWKYHNHGRAIVPNQGFDAGERDPKVFWHEASQRWVMVLWVQNNPGRVRFFTSTNLKDWTFASDLMRNWAFECMDMFPLQVDGNAAQTKWVIYDANFDYEIGSFDGTTFTTEMGPFQAGRGNFYAAQSFNQAPNGRVVQIGWMNGGPNSAGAYGLPYNQQMGFPCDLTLRTTPSGVRLCVYPIPEISSLATSTHQVTSQALTPASNLLSGAGNLDLVDLSLEFSPGTASQVIIDLPRTSVRYETATGAVSFTGLDGNQAVAMNGNFMPRNGRVKLRLLLDRLSLEAYAFDGEAFGSHYLNPNNGVATPSLRSVGGDAFVHSLTVNSLASTWTAEPPLSTSLQNPGFEDGMPSGSTFRTTIPGWNQFGDWTEAAGALDDSGNALSQAAGYPDFNGLGAASLRARNGSTENRAGIYQSLGRVALSDLGKTYTLTADLGARINDGTGNYSHSGDLTLAFRKGVNGGIGGERGTLLGSAGVRSITADDAALPSLASVAFAGTTATFTPAMEDVGTEVFVVIDLGNTAASASATNGLKEYLVDNVWVQSEAVPLPAGPMAYEGFDYENGTNLTGLYGGHGWAGAWQTINGGTADVVAGSLVAGSASPVGYDDRSAGNSSSLPNGRRVGRSLDTSPAGTFGARGYLDTAGRIGKDGTTVYLSFTQQPNGTSLFYEFEFHRDDLGDSGRIAGIGNDAAGTNVNLRAPNGTQTLIGPGNTNVNFYVVRIDFKPGNDDVFVYRNPTTATEPVAPTLTRLAATDMSFNGISFGAFVNGRTVKHDEIRIGRSWADVIGVGPYLAWSSSKGLDGSPGKEAGFEADPDRDGIANGLEWVLGGDPLSGDASSLMTTSGNSTAGLSLSFSRDETTPGSASLWVQYASTLAGPWTSVPVSQSGGSYPNGVTVVINETASPDQVTVTIPAGNALNGRLFARLRATTP